MSFSEAKLQGFCGVDKENETPESADYDSYKKEDGKNLKTIDVHKSKTKKKSKAKLEKILRKKVTKPRAKPDKLTIESINEPETVEKKNETVTNETVEKEDEIITNETAEKKDETNINETTTDNNVQTENNNFGFDLLELMSHEILKSERRMTEMIDRIVVNAERIEENLRQQIRLKDLYIRCLKWQLFAALRL